MLPLRVRVDLGAMAMKRYSPIPQSTSITGASPSDCLVAYLGHSLGGGLAPQQRCSQCIQQPQLTGLVYSWSVHRGKENILLAEFKSAVVWMVTIFLWSPVLPCLFSRNLLTIPGAPNTIAITVTFMCHCFLSSWARFKHLSVVMYTFIFSQLSTGTVKSTR